MPHRRRTVRPKRVVMFSAGLVRQEKSIIVVWSNILKYTSRRTIQEQHDEFLGVGKNQIQIHLLQPRHCEKDAKDEIPNVRWSACTVQDSDVQRSEARKGFSRQKSLLAVRVSKRGCAGSDHSSDQRDCQARGLSKFLTVAQRSWRVADLMFRQTS